MSKDEISLSRVEIGGNKYEVIVDPYKAYEFKKGRIKNINEVLRFEEVFKDAKKGVRPSKNDLIKDFKTMDIREVAKKIVAEGRIQLTAKQRKEMVEANTRRIIDHISKNFLDPRTGKPHPTRRVELALKEASISVDPFESYLNQVQEAVKKLKQILPLKPVEKRASFLEIIIPAEFSGKSYGEIKKKCEVIKEKWEGGKLWVQVKTPPTVEEEILSYLSSLTRGNVRVKKIG